MKVINRIVLSIVICIAIQGCDRNHSTEIQGYIEGDFTYISSQTSGEITDLNVYRGQFVKQGTPLFSQEDLYETQSLQQVNQQLNTAIAQLEDLTNGSRPEELAVVRAQLAKATSLEALAKSKLDRQRKIAGNGAISEFELETTSAEYKQHKASVDELKKQLKVQQLPARVKLIQAQEAQIEAIRAQQAQAQWALSKKQVNSPLSALVFDILFKKGEQVNAGKPVISLLAPENIKVRFFIPQTQLGKIRIGDEVLVECDGCADTISTKIDFISPKAEFTPPVVYTNQQREKMLFLVESRPVKENAFKLHPGQPVRVILQ